MFNDSSSFVKVLVQLFVRVMGKDLHRNAVIPGGNQIEGNVGVR